jgi:tetraacyldisaccharide 4'-kinase
MAARHQELWLIRWWYQKSPWAYLLLPLSLLYGLLSALRRLAYRRGWLSSFQAAVPVIVVGNISAGGTGKTPVVIALVKALQHAGYRPGIISRGYGSQAPQYPFIVRADSDPLAAGDEPLLMAQRSGVPVVIDALRKNAVQHLLANSDCNIIVGDDGLQHYALQRSIEIVVVDSTRGFGNRLLLPAGPLRERVSRLATVDYVISNGGRLNDSLPARSNSLAVQEMQLKASQLANIASGETLAVEHWRESRQVHAVAGIGNPQRFYNSLRQLGFTPIEHSFGDHHPFSSSDLQLGDDLPIIMTEKDAVKVARLNPPDNCWYLPVEAVIDEAFYQAIIAHLQRLTNTPN